MKRLAIIGAGLSGILLARALYDKAEIVLFEKARGLGGRISTRHANRFSFDHGAPFFTASTAQFRSFLAPYFQKKNIAEWAGEVIELGEEKTTAKNQAAWLESHLVAMPNMNSLCYLLAEGLDIRLNCEVAPLLRKTKKTWSLLDKENAVLGDFDGVISTAPAAQTIELFKAHLPSDAPITNCMMKPCYTLMLGFERMWDQSWIAAEVHDSPIASILVNSSKPGRDASVTCLVVHSTNAWAQAHTNDDKKHVQDFLLEQFACLTGIDTSRADYCALHLWRYAIADGKTTRSSGYLDAKRGLAATGDWCAGSEIEAVWIHAKQIAGDIAREML